MKNNVKPFIMAVACFSVMAFCGGVVAQTQDSTLARTTGPNVLGKGELQWSTQMEYYNLQWYQNQPYVHSTRHNIGLEGGLRWGIGHKAELTFGLNGVSDIWKDSDSSATRYMGTSASPRVGVRMELFGGRGVLPQVTFVTELSVNKAKGYDYWCLQPLLGLQFRNRIGRYWMLDYSLGYSWNRLPYYYVDYGNPSFLYSLIARWLPTDRLMLGVGVENSAVQLEARWQATPELQLSLQGNYRVGYDLFEGVYSSDVKVGLHWLLQ